MLKKLPHVRNGGACCDLCANLDGYLGDGVEKDCPTSYRPCSKVRVRLDNDEKVSLNCRRDEAACKCPGFEMVRAEVLAKRMRISMERLALELL